MDPRTRRSEGPGRFGSLHQPCGDASPTSVESGSLPSPPHKSLPSYPRLSQLSVPFAITDMLSLPAPLRTLWLQDVQDNESLDLEDQGQVARPALRLMWRRKGRILTAVAVVGSLAILTTLSLASHIYLTGPTKAIVLHSPPTRDPHWQSRPLYKPSPSHLPSARWSPTIITDCTPNMQPYYAPCIAQRTYGAVSGQELIYPDFRLREPVFAQSRLEQDQSLWRTFAEGIRERAARCSDEWYCYRGQHGQNIILANATYTGSPPADTWSDEACMSDGVSIRGISVLAEESQLSDAEYAAAYPVDSLLIATSPDSWSFQHFLDRITHIVAQGADLARNASTLEAITGRKPDRVVAEMWEMLGFPETRLHHRESVGAREIIFGCRTPLSHPWLSLRLLEKFGLNNTRVPLEERKKVVYFSRSEGHANNGGRRVLNEEELLADIRRLLIARGQDEELVMFRQDDFQSQSQLMKWFESNVRAVVGPHGGALYNHRWAGLHTLVIEFTPTSHPSQMFWEEASMLGQVYANLIIPSGADTNMVVDVPAILEILSTHLGKPDARGPAITEAYRWHAPEVMGPL